jgi:hypothetical protein
MDFVARACEEIQKRVFFATADLLNLEVDLLLYDTTSAYFGMDDNDVDRLDRADGWQGVRRRQGGGADPTAAARGERPAFPIVARQV